MNAADTKSPWPLVLPLLVYLVAGMFEPRFNALTTDDVAAVSGQQLDAGELQANEQYVRDQREAVALRYCLIYGLKVAATCGLLGYFARGYFRHFPYSVSSLGVMAGVAGVVVWVALSQLQPERSIASLFGVEAAERSQFNPFEQIASAEYRWMFLALRFFGLVAVVPVCEELFLRGFLMRYVQSTEWWLVSLARIGWRAALVAPLYGAVTHPGEVLAAVAWFSMITWVVSRTGKFWDAVIAHALTNLLLGLYICSFGQWHLW